MSFLTYIKISKQNMSVFLFGVLRQIHLIYIWVALELNKIYKKNPGQAKAGERRKTKKCLLSNINYKFLLK